MGKQTTDDDRALLEDLGVDITPAPPVQHSAKEERVIAGFREIERFVADHGHLPQHGEQHDIFERLFAMRLDRLRQLEECRTLLEPLDTGGLLNHEAHSESVVEEELTDEALLASLGTENQEDDVTRLMHVRSRQEIKAAEEIAQRTPCEDFDEFRPFFETIQHELQTGERKTVKYRDNAEIRKGDLFILDGQKVVVADAGEPFVSDYGRMDSRLRVVYDNATESDLLLRSLQRALNKDKASRRITEPGFGPLFSGEASDDDLATGYIYVLRSQSEHPDIARHRTIIHKIGVTGGDVRQRIANAKHDPTYLLADVEVVATFQLANINRRRLEALLKNFFDTARLDIVLKDRFGKPVKPKEWFLVPLEVIREVVDKIRLGTIEQLRYDPQTAKLVRR